MSNFLYPFHIKVRGYFDIYTPCSYNYPLIWLKKGGRRIVTQENISATRIIVGESQGWRGVNVSNAKTARTVANGRSWDVAFQTLNCTLSLSIPHVDDSSYQKDSSSLFRKKVDSEWNNPFQQRRGAIEGAIRWVETWKSKLTQWKGK